MLFNRHKTELPDRRPGPARPHRAVVHPRRASTWCSTPRWSPRRDPRRATRSRVFGLGCFWGAEEIFWQMPGVWSTSVGYAGGTTPNPSYEEVCCGRTGHTEAVRVVFDPAKVVVRRPGQGVLRGPRPDPGHAPGQRRRHAVPLGDLHAQRPSRSEVAAAADRGVPAASSRSAATARSPPRSSRRRRTTTPRTTTSSTSRRTRTATAATRPPGSPTPAERALRSR